VGNESKAGGGLSLGDVAKLLTFLVSAWGALQAFLSTHVWLAVCCGLTAAWLLTLFADSKGWLKARFAPARETLCTTLEGKDRDAHGRSQQINVGQVLQPRLDELARGSLSKARSKTALARADDLLSALYHCTPFHPQAFLQALAIAWFYSILFFTVPWLMGGEGRLGNAVLLNGVTPPWERWLVMLPWIISGSYSFWMKKRFGVGARMDIVVSLMIGAGVAAFVLPDVSTGFGALIFAGTFVCLFAGLGAGAIVWAFAFAFAGIFVFAGGIVVPSASRVLSGLAVGVAASLGFIVMVGVENEVRRKRKATLARIIVALFGPVIALSSAPLWLGQIIRLKPDPFEATSPAFVLFFFLSLLPLLNAFFDFFSVGITQWCLRRMKRGAWTLWVWLLDIAAALVLVAGLYASVYGALVLMQKIGWGVSPRYVFQQFVDNPSSSVWLLLLAVTNLLPTLLHWSVSLIGFLQERLGNDAKHAAIWAKQINRDEPLSAADADSFARYLLSGSHWCSVALMVALAAWASWGVSTVTLLILRTILK
jgi:hypothetical protein